MELSRERKIFIGIFMTAVAALGIDRGLLAPGEASGAVPIDPAQAAPPPTADAAIASSEGGVGKAISMFARKLQELDQGGRFDPSLGGDAFSVPAAWLETPEPELSAPAQVVPSGPPQFKLSSVMPTRRGGVAVIDGKTYRQGESVGSCVLELVEPRSVVLRRGDSLYRIGLTVQP